jgi:3-isopropylmalate/(R)-2-methylmalate dehydratase small subunit
MKEISTIEGRAYPLRMRDVDTDVIIAANRLKIIDRKGLGAFVFEKIRTDPTNIFDDGRFNGAHILVAGANFGCGSSREHAVWAMADFGIEVVIAPSFGDLFMANARKNGMLTISLPEEDVDRLMTIAEAGGEVSVDLPGQIITAGAGEVISFEIDPFQKDCLVRGLDEIELALQMENEIETFEERRLRATPWLAHAGVTS